MMYARSNKKRFNTYLSTVNVNKGSKNDSFFDTVPKKIKRKRYAAPKKKTYQKRATSFNKFSVCN